MPTLHELTIECQRIMTAIDEADGEITPDVADRLDALEGSREAKVDSYCRLMRNFELMGDEIAAVSVPFEDEAKRLKARAAPHYRAVERLRARLKMELEAQGIDKIKTARFTVSIYGIAPEIAWTADGPPPDVFRDSPVLNKAMARDWYKLNGWLPEGFSVKPKTAMRIT